MLTAFPILKYLAHMNQNRFCKKLSATFLFQPLRKNLQHRYLLSIGLFLTLFTACTQQSPDPPAYTPPGDTTTQIPPADTTVDQHEPDANPGLLMLQEVYIQSNPHIVRPNRNFTFYYDDQQRVSTVGIRYFSVVAYDTAVTTFFYHGNSRHPYMVICPNRGTGNPATNYTYDTVLFWYDAAQRLIMDSGYSRTFDGSRKLLVRHYTYTTADQFSIDLYEGAGDADLSLFRHDEVTFNTDSTINTVKILYYSQGIQVGWVFTNGITYSNYRNPLANLNISGLYYDWLETPNDKEIFGNDWDKSTTNLNTLPYYMDFSSVRIPYYFGFNSGYPELFDIQITPLNANSSYPQLISVGAATALEDRFEYTYYYD
jgi:hypothetical protein